MYLHVIWKEKPNLLEGDLERDLEWCLQLCVEKALKNTLQVISLEKACASGR